MKNMFFMLLIAALLPVYTQAQKAKGKIINFSYMQLPSNPLEGDFKTYSVKVRDRYSTLVKMGLTDNQIASNYFNFQLYEKVPSKGDFEILIELGEPAILSQEVVTTTKTVGKGDAAKKVKYYHYEVAYHVPMSYQLKDGARAVMREGVMNDQVVYKTKENKSRSTMVKAWIEVRNSTMNKNYASYIKGNLSQISKRLYSQIDHRPHKILTNFYRIKKAEKYKVEQYTKAFDLTKKVLEGATADTPLEELQTSMQPAVKIWEAGLKKYNPKEKKQRGMYFTSAFNLGKMYTLFGDFDRAKDYIEKAKESDKKAGYIRQLEDLLNNRIKRKKANENIVMTYKGTYAATEASEDDAMVMAVNITNDYVVTEANDTIIGDIKIERSAFGVSKIIVTNGYDTNHPVKDFHASKIKLVRKGMASHHLIKLHPSDKLNGATLELAEIIYVTEKAGIYKKRRKDGEYQMYFMKNTKGAKSANIAGLRFLNFNKGVGKYFNDCPEVVNKAKNKEYQLSEESLIQVIDDYTACQ